MTAVDVGFIERSTTVKIQPAGQGHITVFLSSLKKKTFNIQVHSGIQGLYHYGMSREQGEQHNLMMINEMYDCKKKKKNIYCTQILTQVP